MKQIEFIGIMTNDLATIIEENEIDITCVEDTICKLEDNDYDLLKKLALEAFEGGDILDVTFDVAFNDDTSSDSKGLINATYEECLNYIKHYNGTDESYFKDYKGGSVSIVRNETGDTLYTEDIPFGKVDVSSIKAYNSNFEIWCEQGHKLWCVSIYFDQFRDEDYTPYTEIEAIEYLKELEDFSENALDNIVSNLHTYEWID